MSAIKFLNFIILASIMLTACAVGPDFHAPNTPQLSRYTYSPLPAKTVSAQSPGGNSQYFIMGRDIPADWWTLFHSQPLNDLICKGITHSPNLDAATAALSQAEENLKAQIGSTMVPAISGQFTPERQRFSDSTLGLQNVPGQVFNLYNANINVSYTLDVFGGLRRQIEAAGALVDYQCFQLRATYLTLTANIVTTSVAAASLRKQIQATHELIHIQEDLLHIVQKQYELGGASGTDVLTQQTQLAQTRALLPPLEKSLAQTCHALSVLVGAFPCEGGIPILDLDTLHLPRRLPVSLPSKLVCQRPDVRAASALLEQASAQIGVATANLLPQFPLTASYGSEVNWIGNLFTQQGVVWTLVGNVMQPIFNGGALIARRKAAIFAYNQALAQYKQTVLQAFQNVADALRALEIDAQTLQAQTIAEKAAKETLAITKKQYSLGGVSYINLLNAQLLYQQALISRIQAQAARYADTAALFQALGGGWWNQACCNT